MARNKKCASACDPQSRRKVAWSSVAKAMNKVAPQHHGTPRHWQRPVRAEALIWSRECVPLNQVREVQPHSARDVKRYARVSPSSQPPVLLSLFAAGVGMRLTVDDGAHRVAAARLRGDACIDAYVGRPRDYDEAAEIQRRERDAAMLRR